MHRHHVPEAHPQVSAHDFIDADPRLVARVVGEHNADGVLALLALEQDRVAAEELEVLHGLERQGDNAVVFVGWWFVWREGGMRGRVPEGMRSGLKKGRRERQREKNLRHLFFLPCSLSLAFSPSPLLVFSLTLSRRAALTRRHAVASFTTLARPQDTKLHLSISSLTCCRRWSRRRRSACWATFCAPGWPW